MILELYPNSSSLWWWSFLIISWLCKQIPELNTLEKIDLANNGITNIQYDAFDNLDYVYQLILSNNSIEAITEDIFEWNPLQLKVT